MKYVRYLWKLQKKLPFFLSITLCALLGCIPAALVFARSSLIDTAIERSARFPIWCGWFLFLSLGEALLSAMQVRLTEQHNLQRGKALDQQRLQKANRISFPVTETETFHALYHQGAKAAELDAGCYRSWQSLVTIGVQMSATLVVLWFADPFTAAGIALLLVSGITLHIRVAKGIPGFWGRYMENMRRTNYFASLLLNREYAAERKIFGWDAEIEHRFSRSFQKARKENLQLGKKRFSADALLELFSAVYAVVAVLLLLRPLLRGSLTIGLFTSAFYAANTLRAQTGQICGAVYTLKSQFSQLDGYQDFMTLPEEPAPEAPVSTVSAPAIFFRNVTFTYPGQEKPVLNGINFTLEQGKHYALVGENGSGKSTLVKLLAGLYPPDSGEIRIGDTPLAAFSAEEKQKLFSVVFQDFYRYPLTIRENLSMGQDSLLSDEVILPVLTALDFHPAALERGLDSSLLLLQKDGSGLSGGEWQKLAIARCVLSDAPVAILDEPNASLDPIGEASVYRAYQTLLQDKLTLFISHRLGSVKQADAILVLKDGQLIAADSHRNLMKNCPYYRQLFETQRGLYHEI